MIELHVDKLVGGNIVITTGSSYHSETWYKYSGDTTWRTVDIEGGIEGVDDYTPTE